MTAKHVKKGQRQVNKKFCELKGRTIGIAEKAQETRPEIYSISDACEIGHWESSTVRL